jgi:hypothetical protein
MGAGTAGVCIGQVCISVRRAAGGIAIFDLVNFELLNFLVRFIIYRLLSC